MEEKNITWRDHTTYHPEENTDALVYTDEDKMKVARLCRGKWDTYQKIIGWYPLPKDKPTKVKKKKKGE